MENYSAQELFEILNNQDECDWIEAKGGHESSHSVMETVCAFANEPGLGGGYILMGVAEDHSQLFPQYKLNPINDPDTLQKNFVSQCSSMFNFPIRPSLSVEQVNGKTVVKIKVQELPQNQKPLYFKADGLPHGAMRRVGPTDQHCTEDDMQVFYQGHDSFDQTPIQGSTFDDFDENAIKRYRQLREKINPTAEELTYEDDELLEALGCVNKTNKNELNLAGLMLFGTSKAQRKYYPMLRVDYIRVPGNSWVENPDDRFTTIDMRGPLLLVLYRLIDAVNADLPKGFLLPDGEVQATSAGLPTKALREAIVNALMHRSYREHRPTQVVRYDNRIEIINPGFSLKAEDKLGEPGSETRNPFIAAVFHETNLAETKGSGIRAMRKLMEESHLVPPTFDSSRENNHFISRLLLHHFLDESDLVWLDQFSALELNDAQKQALVFVREVGAIDNHTYRQMANCDIIRASGELRFLKSKDLLKSKGKGKATYYVAGTVLSESTKTPASSPNTPPQELNTPPPELNTPPPGLNTPPPFSISIEIQQEIDDLGRRFNDVQRVKDIIIKICEIKPFKAVEIASFFNKQEDYFKRKYLTEMIQNKDLLYTYPEMINHPEQAYRTNSKK